MHYSLNAIRAFDLAARHKSFKTAADKLNVTPTAISHLIRRLEQTLGISLFQRKTRAVELTAAGKKLMAVTNSALHELDVVINQLQGKQQKLTISTTSSFASLCLIPVLNLFLKSHPDVEVSIQTGENLESLKRQDNIDLAIRFGNLNDVEDGHILAVDPVNIYAAPSFAAHLDKLTGQTLLETRWKNPALPSVSWLDLGIKAAASNTIRQFDQEHQVIHAALAGQGLALTSSLLVKNFVQEGWLKPISIRGVEPQNPHLGYYLVYPDRIEPNKNLEKFVCWLTSSFG